MRHAHTRASLFLLTASLLTLTAVAGVAPSDRDVAAPEATEAMGFLENRGQIDPAVLYYVPGPAPLFVARGAVVIDLRKPPGEGRRRGHAVWIRFPGGLPGAAVTAGERSSTRVHVLKGADPGRWRRHVRTFGTVTYHDLWPGIDLVLRPGRDRLHYRLVVHTGGDPAMAALDFDGADRIVNEGQTGRRIETTSGILHEQRRDDGLAGTIAWTPAPSPPGELPGNGGTEDGPTDGTDAALSMSLRFSTYLSGDEWFASNEGLAVDVEPGTGSVIVAGRTSDTVFPTTPGAYDEVYGGIYDGFVARFTPDGTGLVWATYLGSTAGDEILDLALDGSGNPVVAGVTESSDFPTTDGSFDGTHNGGEDIFVAKLTVDGSGLTWSTFVGGTGDEGAEALTLDAGGAPTITGGTTSGDFPTTTGAYRETPAGGKDVFAVTLLADGSDLGWSTLLGGTADETGRALALDASGRVAVVGETVSTDFPTSPGAYSASPGGSLDGFVSVVSADGSTLDASTYLGGTQLDSARGVATDAEDRFVVTGFTESTGFPTTAQAFDESFNGLRDVFVSTLSADLASLVWSTFLGGDRADVPYGLELSSAGMPVIAGSTCSTDLPVSDDAFQGTYVSTGSLNCDGFVAALGPDGRSLRYGTYLGSLDDEWINDLRLGAGDAPVITGATYSTSDFPTTPGAHDADGGPFGWDAFVSGVVYPTACVQIFGEVGPRIDVVRAQSGSCPSPVGGSLEPADRIDLIRGDIGALGPADIGDVVGIVCVGDRDLYQVDIRPATGEGFFYLSRYSPAGDYTEGGGLTLVGARIPLSEDCP